MTTPDTSPGRETLALRKIEALTGRYLYTGGPVVEKFPAEEVALIKTVYDLALQGLGKDFSDDEAPASCTRCGAPHGRTKPWNGEPEDLCEACERFRIAEIERVYEHHEAHPDECCCHTYLGRECCMAPIHGEVYRALCIEHGERFTTDFRAKDREEAMELGREHAAGWGGECIRVWKVRRNLTRRAHASRDHR